MTVVQFAVPITEQTEPEAVTSQFHKTKLCPNFKKGKCKNGSKCRYAHGDGELRQLPDLKCTKLCDLVMHGEPCTRINCGFAHKREDLRTSDEAFYKVSLCNFYKRGRCLNGGFCRFAHGLSELRGPLPKKKTTKKENSLSVPGGSGVTLSCCASTCESFADCGFVSADDYLDSSTMSECGSDLASRTSSESHGSPSPQAPYPYFHVLQRLQSLALTAEDLIRAQPSHYEE